MGRGGHTSENFFSILTHDPLSHPGFVRQYKYTNFSLHYQNFLRINHPKESKMSDSPFEDFCISCDKVCSLCSIYCSEECKALDERHQLTSNYTRADCYNDSIPDYNDHNLLESPLMAPAYSTKSDVVTLDLNQPCDSDYNMMAYAGQNYRKWLAMC